MDRILPDDHSKPSNPRNGCLRLGLTYLLFEADFIPGALEQKFHDPEDRVRLQVIRVFEHLELQNLISIPLTTFKQLYERCSDKKIPVRAEAIEVLSKIFHKIYVQFEKSNDEAILKKFQWIPGALIDILYNGDIESKLLIEKAYFEELFSPMSEDERRAKRLAVILSLFNEKQYQGFLSIVKNQSQVMQSVKVFIEYAQRCQSDSQSESDKKVLTGIVQHLAARMPDPKKMIECLYKVAKAESDDTFDLISAMMSPVTGYKQVIKDKV